MNKYSAGCQVFADPLEFKEFLDRVYSSLKNAKKYCISYTLLTANDLPADEDPAEFQGTPVQKNDESDDDFWSSSASWQVPDIINAAYQIGKEKLSAGAQWVDKTVDKAKGIFMDSLSSGNTAFDPRS